MRFTLSTQRSAKWVITIVLVVAFALCFWFVGRPSDSDRKRLAELHKLAAETPRYPDFKQSGESERAKSSVADYTVSYGSAASTDKVKIFYVRALSNRGWSVVRGNEFGDGELVFGKGEYVIAISHIDDRYVISYAWRSP